MKIKEIIKMWYEGLAKTDKTIKKLEKKKLTFKDGAVSLIALNFIIALLFLIGVLLLTSITGSDSTAMLTEGLTLFIGIFVGFSIISVIGLAIFTWLFRKVADKHKGKGKFGKEAGFFGILIGMFFLTMIPYILGYGLMILTETIPLLSFLFLGIGMLIYMAYIGKVAGLAVEVLSAMEKIKIHKLGWIYGLTMGIIYLIGMLLFGLTLQIMVVMGL